MIYFKPCKVVAPIFERRAFVDDKNEKSYEKVMEYVKNRIVDGSLRQGDKLPAERFLADSLSIGRYSVREGMRALESLGIVECVHGGGNYISGNFEAGLARLMTMTVLLKKTDCFEMDFFRCGLEKQAAFLCIQGKNIDCGGLKAMAEKMKTAQPDECAALDLSFHRQIYSSAANTLINIVLEAVSEITSSIIGNVWNMADADERKKLANMHRLIAENIENGSAEAAYRAIDGHYAFVDGIFKKEKHSI